MREDMYKVIVERPRRGKYGYSLADRLRNDLDGPMRLGMRAGYGHRSLNENLAPLRRYLHAQIGRPWNKVYSEICASVDRRNTVQQHIHQHIETFIAIDVGVRDAGISRELYVDPRTGLIRPNKGYRSWRHSVAQSRRREQLEIATRRRILDQHTMLLLLNDLWFRVEAEVLPKERPVAGDVDGRGRAPAESRYDVVLRRSITRANKADLERCKHLYGAALYAVSKRQISTREIKAYQLR